MLATFYSNTRECTNYHTPLTLLTLHRQNMALQRFPVGKWMSLNIFAWSIALSTHAACTNFGGLFAGIMTVILMCCFFSVDCMIIVRFIMGLCEGSITAGFMIVTSMFYTRNEQSQRVGYWCKFILWPPGVHWTPWKFWWTEQVCWLSGHSHLILNLGLAQIISGFLSFGVLHIKHSTLHPWQWWILQRFQSWRLF